MTYKETLNYLFSQLPMFQRVGAAAYKADLNNTIALNNLLKNPQNKFKSIHIAGTNGKGSVSHYSASILQQAGYKTGLFTSPHLKDFRERIKINGKKIPKKEVTNFVNTYKIIFSEIKPSFFEWSFALASWYFAKNKVDIAVFETGMGGRLDSTNTIKPVISCITNISFDHMAFLGNTLPEIASEKAGIIKQNTPIVIGETQSEISKIFIDKAKLMKAPIFFADKNFIIKETIKSTNLRYKKYIVEKTENQKKILIQTPLTASYQKKNIVTVLCIFDTINQKKILDKRIDEEHIFLGIKNLAKNNPIEGRWQMLNKKPLVFADIAHNVDGIYNLLEQLESVNYKKLHIVIGMANDKDITKMLSLLPQKANYYFCKADVPRGLESNELKTIASKVNLKGKAYKTVKIAYENALKNAQIDDVIIITGSAFVVAEII